ncbi:MAG: aminotransferase class I/II-fold pyridoxal phosphate-dependent enzyme [Chloroflexi bacterium]|nr:MAG: aminotransferase class I/II-fold pyridoxal phosphate-dependent enzyme [Chloroflexota bacterium]
MSVPAGAIDLRSDTLTVPDAGMRAAIAAAEVGDDVWGEDPTVRRLEEGVAALLDKQAAVFVPSGTMANLAAVAAQTRPGDEVIADAQAHVALHEAGGSAAVAGVQLRLLDGFEGTPDAAMVRDAVRDQDIHNPTSKLLCLENTHNRRGGCAIALQRITAAAGAAHAEGLRVHCDGARLFNAAVALDCAAAALVGHCDTVSVCLSKGLGAPVGSVVAGDDAVIAEVRRWRKRLGGGMRQAGVLAAAGLYALDNNVARLADDHANARVIASALRGVGGATLLEPTIPTNSVMLRTAAPADVVVREAAARGVALAVMGPDLVRGMTHLGVTDTDARRAAEVLSEVLAG